MELRPREVLLHDGGRKRPLALKVQSLVRTVLAAGALQTAAMAAAAASGGQQQQQQPPAAAAAAAPSSCVFVSRQYFDQDKGAELIRRLSVDPIDNEMLDSYVFLASAHCLLRYIEATYAVRFPPGCVGRAVACVWWVAGCCCVCVCPCPPSLTPATATHHHTTTAA